MTATQRSVKQVSAGKRLDHDPDRLRYRRVAAGLSFRGLAGKSGVASGHISDLERGLHSARATTLAALARALDCKITDLMPSPPGVPSSAENPVWSRDAIKKAA